MFMVINKDKIISYIVSLSTVAVLFMMSVAITKKNNEILDTSANLFENEVENIVIENTLNSNNTIKKEYNTDGLN